MTYLTENPWPLTIALLAIAAFLASNAMKTHQKKLWRVVHVCLALAAVPVLVDFLVETPREQVTGELESLADAVRQNDIQQTLSFVGAMNADNADVRNLIEQGMPRIDVQSLRLKTVRISAADSKATSDFRANGSVGLTRMGGSRHVATRWVLNWRKTGDDWKITAINRLDPISGDVINTFAAAQ